MKIHHLYISQGHDFKGRHGKGRLHNAIQSVDSIECVAGRGIQGDRYFDYKENFKGQITFFDYEIYKKIKEEFNQPDIIPSVFRRNIIVSGVDLNTLIDQKFTLQGIEFEGSEECAPCYWMDEAICPGVEDRLKGFGGLRARILTSGTLKKD